MAFTTGLLYMGGEGMTTGHPKVGEPSPLLLGLGGLN